MLIRSISGIRGLVKEDLNRDAIIQYANALHTTLKPGVVYAGRDSRPSGETIIEIMIEELLKRGRTVIYCGIVPTPTIQFMVHTTEAVGGFIITASHNPIDWNGIKFVREDSTFFHLKDCEKLFGDADNFTPDSLHEQEKGMLWEEKNAIHKHTVKCTSLECINLDNIRQKKFKVVIDAVNGAGSHALPAMLELLGCEVIILNCEPNGEFTRGTEPLPEQLLGLSEKVINHQADVGFAVDPDADRLAVVDENGQPLGEEYTLVLAADGYLNTMQTKEKFVTNLSTSLALDKLATSRKCSVERAEVGEINVVNKMNDIGANLGGEGNGGVILRECHLGRDSLVAATMVLNRMSQSEDSLSAIYHTLPQYKIVKDKISIKGLDKELLLSKVNDLFPEAEKNTSDGLKFIWEGKWIHLRSSNTEPIMRIYAEASSEQEAQELILKIKRIV
ncbi:MAG: phosphoglucosamine mutase [Candidatus Marinimicrobia bacterium]|jgi:phosphomannomutase|nr:phosphoglucosamine mutase [Candidatus Neomarinimicrobiota bacterium]|tara:strand:+ start:1258 stop:2598 length:1341 start_codon:yes stop_codon:yes gene_type:complete